VELIEKDIPPLTITNNRTTRSGRTSANSTAATPSSVVLGRRIDSGKNRVEESADSATESGSGNGHDTDDAGQKDAVFGGHATLVSLRSRGREAVESSNDQAIHDVSSVHGVH